MGGTGPWLHGIRYQTLICNINFNYMISFFKSLITGLFIPKSPFETGIVLNFIMDKGFAIFRGRLSACCGREYLVIHFNEIQSIPGYVGIFSYHSSDRISNVADLVRCKRPADRYLIFRHLPNDWHLTNAAINEILAHKHVNDAFHGLCSISVYTFYICMCMRAP